MQFIQETERLHRNQSALNTPQRHFSQGKVVTRLLPIPQFSARRKSVISCLLADQKQKISPAFQPYPLESPRQASPRYNEMRNPVLKQLKRTGKSTEWRSKLLNRSDSKKQERGLKFLLGEQAITRQQNSGKEKQQRRIQDLDEVDVEETFYYQVELMQAFKKLSEMSG